MCMCVLHAAREMQMENLLAISEINQQVSNWRAPAGSKMANRVINFSANVSQCVAKLDTIQTDWESLQGLGVG